MNIDMAEIYIRKLRKPSKRAYAERYWAWLVGRACGTEPNERGPEYSGLSYMGAQAVRMRLADYAPEAFTQD